MLRLEVFAKDVDGDAFGVIGEVRLGQPDGSVSDNLPDGERDIYIFGVDPIAHCGYLKRSRMGIDSEVGAQRVIDDLEGFETISTFGPGESRDLVAKTDASPAPRALRLSCRDD